AMEFRGSTRATELKPSRLVAAQEAARAFVADQPKTTRIGVVSFAATASVVQSPTHSREDILAAIERFTLQRGTAVGSGILISLKMIFPDVEFDLRSYNPRNNSQRSAALDTAKAPDHAARAHPRPPRQLRGRGHHPADRRADDHGSRSDRVGPHGRRSRRTRLYS